MTEYTYETLISSDADRIFTMIQFRDYENADKLISSYEETDAFMNRKDRAFLIAVSCMRFWYSNEIGLPSGDILSSFSEDEADNLDTRTAVMFLTMKCEEASSKAVALNLAAKAYDKAKQAEDPGAIAFACQMLSDLHEEDADTMIRLRKEALDNLRKLFGEKDWRTIIAQADYSRDLCIQDSKKALSVAEQALKSATDSGNEMLTAQVLEAVSEIYAETEEFGKSIDAMKESCEILEKLGLLQREDTDILKERYLRAGKAADALDIAISEAAEAKVQYGEESIAYASALISMLRLLHETGREEEALENARKQYDIFRSQKAGSVPLQSMVLSVSFLAFELEEAESKEECAELLASSFLDFTDIYPEEKNVLIRYYEKYIFQLISDNKILLSALSSLCGKIDKETELYATVAADLVLVYRKEGRHDEALALAISLKELGEKLHGNESVHYAASMQCLALTYLDQGNSKRAARYLRQALDIYLNNKENWANEGIITNVRQMLAAIDLDNHNYEEAIVLLQDLYGYYRKTGSVEDAIAVAEDLSIAYSSIEKWQESLECCQKAYEAYKDTAAADDPGFISLIMNLAMAYSNADDHQKALELFMECYEKNLRVCGKDDRDTKEALLNAAKEQHYLGHDNESVLLASRTLSLLSPSDYDLKEDCYSTLFIAHDSLGNSKKSDEFKKKLNRIRQGR